MADAATLAATKALVKEMPPLPVRLLAGQATARQGDIFTPVASQEFRRVILEVTSGSGSAIVMKTIAEGEPVKGWPLTINGDYPDDLPFTTLPPTLLLRLPQLPPQVAYRIIGHNFVLQDAVARVILDFIPAALP